MITEKQSSIFGVLSERAAGLSGYPIESILSKNRSHGLVNIRVAMAVALKGGHWRLKDIAWALNRDHSTIIHMMRIYESWKFMADRSDAGYMQMIDMAEALALCVPKDGYAKKLHDRGLSMLSVIGLVNS